MNEAQSQVQSVEQAGTPGKTTGVGLEVGVLRSSQETPVTGVERRRDTCLGVRRGRDRWPRKGIRLYGAKPPTLAKSTAGNCGGVTGLGKPDTGNPSVRFDEGSESDGHWSCLSSHRLRPTLLRGFSAPEASQAGELHRLVLVSVQEPPKSCG